MKKLIFAVVSLFIITSTASAGKIGGHEYVDLGLPSGTLWATCNIGTVIPERDGDLFSWGEIRPKENCRWDTYRFWGGTKNIGIELTMVTKYCIAGLFGKDDFVDNKTELEPIDDVASVYWGQEWRMPTMDEFDELMMNCDVQPSSRNGVPGIIVTGSNGNSIFFPAAGYRDKDGYHNSVGRYWTSSLFFKFPSCAYALYFDSGECGFHYYGRYIGCSVRAVVAKSNKEESTSTPVSVKPQNAPSQNKSQKPEKPVLTK